MRINLIQMNTSKYGGVTSFVAHLSLALAKRGHNVRILYIRKKTEAKPRVFMPGIDYWNVSLRDCVSEILNNRSWNLVTAVYWPHQSTEAEVILSRKVGLVLHDPAEWFRPLIDVVRDRGIVPVVIRKANVSGLRSHGIDSVYIPHPYIRSNPKFDKERKWACSLSRIDWDKYTHILVEANEKLPRERQIDIYGAKNRIYVWHKVRSVCADWEAKYYRGTFPLTFNAGAYLAARYRHVVDMSAIKGDGGGTQYSFFEAWDAGAALILNREWVSNPAVQEPEVDEQSAVFVRDSDELADVLRSGVDPAKFRSRVEELFSAHDPELVAKQYEDYFRRVLL